MRLTAQKGVLTAHSTREVTASLLICERSYTEASNEQRQRVATPSRAALSLSLSLSLPPESRMRGALRGGKNRGREGGKKEERLGGKKLVENFPVDPMRQIIT